MTWLVLGLSLLSAALAAGVIALARRVTALETSQARVKRVGDAVTLLSETAEAGFAAVSHEIERLQRHDVRPAVTRTMVARRVAKASGSGERIEEIARREALSEGEIRLHLAMAEPPQKKGARRASLRA